MGKTEYDVFGYSNTVVSVFGILSNIFVVISILKQRCLLKNYYILVLHLAICDLGVLIIYLLEVIVLYSTEEPNFLDSVVYCVFGNLFHVFHMGRINVPWSPWHIISAGPLTYPLPPTAQRHFRH